MNILVVEDEFYTRKALVQLILDWNSASKVFEAEDGLEALEMMDTCKPDLVFSDIRMPRIDGLELLALIREKYPSVVSVIISGYDDFIYAQQAIRFKAEQYLLKPVERQEMVALLNRISEHKVSSAEIWLEERLAACLYEEQSFASESNEFGSIDAYTTAVLRADGLQRDIVKQIARRMLSMRGIPFVLSNDRRHSDMVILWMYATDASKDNHLRDRQQILQDVIQAYAETAGGVLSIGLSTVKRDVRELAKSYIEAKHAVLYRLIMGNNIVFDASDMGAVTPYNHEWMNNWITQIDHKVINNRFGDAASLVRKLIAEVSEVRLSVHALYDMCAKITAILNSFIESENKRTGELMPYVEQIDLHQYDSTDEIADKLANLMESAASKLASSSSKFDITEDMKLYVQQHFHQEIILEDLAKNKYFTDPSYLSRLFKNKVGTSFSQYLLSYRMNKAKSLLESDFILSVSDVASAVGYSDYSYFIQMYKKHFGATPGKVKRQKTAERLASKKDSFVIFI
ncbi:response regulator [Paenibacillus albiflavus]|nr:response regulator [Paenibacillus albiflavus]